MVENVFQLFDGSAAALVVALPGGMRARARMGTKAGARVLDALPLRPGACGAPGAGRVGAPDGGLPGAGLHVGVVLAEA